MRQEPNIADYNREAWNRQVERENRWTTPVSPEQVAAAREGRVEVVLTPVKIVPQSWYPPLKGARVLCLASGGGQQAPLFAAAGAEVTVFDNSDAQLARDEEVAQREGLALNTAQGDMRDLSRFEAESFDLVFHPCSISFIPDPRPVFDEVFRVLKPGANYLLGACNPLLYIFDYEKSKKGELFVRHHIPYSDLEQLSEAELEAMRADDEPLCFGHRLEDLIGGQTDAGFHITGFFEDILNDSDENPLDQHIATIIATRARKPD
jgi:SAM-dependent methyltransferase